MFPIAPSISTSVPLPFDFALGWAAGLVQLAAAAVLLIGASEILRAILTARNARSAKPVIAAAPLPVVIAQRPRQRERLAA